MEKNPGCRCFINGYPMLNSSNTNYPDDDPEALRQEIGRLRQALSESALGLPAMLKLRGFKIHSIEPSDDLLIPEKEHITGFYQMMTKYSFRLFLRDVIKHQARFTLKDVTRYATSDVTGDFIQYVLDIGLIKKTGKAFMLPRRIKSFGDTLEWFVSEVLKKEFMTEALWGVKFKGQKTGGDYDIIARIDGSLLYMEVKSSPPKQIYQSEITGFLDRVQDLNPAVSIFFMDTELRMKDKIVPMFEEELKSRFVSPPAVKRMKMELFQISGKLYIINAKHSIAGNIEKVLADYFKSI
jgi:hypothetical protein